MIEQEEKVSRCGSGGLLLDIQKYLFTERVIKLCKQLPKEMLESPSLELLKNPPEMWHLGT